MNGYQAVITAYDGQADILTERYWKVSSEQMLAEVLPMIRSGGDGGLALDVGAGTGRNAVCLTSLGYDVVAAEPAASMRRIVTDKHGDR